MARPIVYLIGAGPGAPDLITARGLRVVQNADVIIYDHMVHARLLREALPFAERIDVGSAAPQRVDQEAICYLLAEKAREGKVVARLKWGDPFVFDRGGEEAVFLRAQGIRFEVVPGVPAALGAPAYAGIPVTFPGGGDTITFVRGYEDDGREPPAVNWMGLAGLDGTLVCYAGPRQIPQMLDALLAAGRPQDDAAAIVANGTLPDQQTLSGTIGTLSQMLKEQPARGPALLIIGKVVGLRDKVRWFDERPLFGRRVLVTRSRDQAGELVDLLEAAGAEAVEAPLIRIAAPEDEGPLERACAEAGRYDWIVFTSANGADSFMRRLLEGPRDVRALAGARICTVGPGTAARLARFGLKVDLIPDEHRAEAIASALAALGPLSGQRILLPQGDIARDVLGDALRAAGAEVTEVVAYRTMATEGDGDLDIYGQLLEHRIDVVTFTSASAIRSFVALFGAEQAADLLNHTDVATIGPVTAEAAARYNIRVRITPATYTIPSLVDAIVTHFRTHGDEAPEAQV
ncbi:MAG: uroporphyrinogen-III C-methyltransferase [Vicinamibacterales bacterium]|nr:uroporphyrinogen-III C-methyltransferase [Vicinamibacterales bacterium]